MQGITGAVAEWLIQKQAIEETERELYEYAVHSLIMLIAPLFMALGIGGLFGEFEMSIVFILPFMILRKYSGGYHAKSQWVCLILSSLLLAVCFWVAEYLVAGLVLSIVLILSSISLAIFSPVDSENRRLSEEEQKAFSKTGRILVVLFLLAYIILLALGKNKSALYLALGVILTAGLQLPCILQKLKK